ncbi:MAG: hypothetical protein WC683_14265 [bacterium]
MPMTSRGLSIGPLLARPALATFVNQMGAVFENTRVLCNREVLMPGALGAGGVISYESSHGSFRPLVDVKDTSSKALALYEQAGGDPLSDAGFVAEANEIESIFFMSTRSIADVLRRESASVHNKADFDAMMRRAQMLEGSKMREIINPAPLSHKIKPIRLGGGFFTETALDSAFAATLAWNPADRDRCREAARLSFISGILFMVGDEFDAKEVLSSFVCSANYYVEGGMHVAAALVSEVAALIEANAADAFETPQNTARRAMNYWLKAAKSLAAKDGAGLAVALYRGLLTSHMAGDEAIDQRRQLLMLSAGVHNAAGRHEEAAEDYLRITMDHITNFKGDAKSWERIADSIRMAIGAYGRAKVSKDTAQLLEELEGLARIVTARIREELGPLDSRIEKDDDIEARLQRAKARLEFADFRGALSDLKWAAMVNGDDAWLKGEMGHVYHFLADYHLQIGNDEAALGYLRSAMYCMREAIKMADESGEEIAVLHARMGALLATLGQFKDSIAELDKARRIAPKDRRIKEYLGAVVDLGKQAEEASNVVSLKKQGQGH